MHLLGHWHLAPMATSGTAPAVSPYHLRDTVAGGFTDEVLVKSDARLSLPTISSWATTM